jgi:hypothetical protein
MGLEMGIAVGLEMGIAVGMDTDILEMEMGMEMD